MEIGNEYGRYIVLSISDIKEDNKTIMTLKDKYNDNKIYVYFDYKNMINNKIDMLVSHMTTDIDWVKLYGDYIFYLSKNNKFKTDTINLSKNKINILPHYWFYVLKRYMYCKFFGKITADENNSTIIIDTLFHNNRYPIEISIVYNTMTINYILPYSKNESDRIKQIVEGILEDIECIMNMSYSNRFEDTCKIVTLPIKIKDTDWFYESVDIYYDKVEMICLNKFIQPFKDTNFYMIEDGFLYVKLGIYTLGDSLHEIISNKNLWEYEYNNK